MVSVPFFVLEFVQFFCAGVDAPLVLEYVPLVLEYVPLVLEYVPLALKRPKHFFDRFSYFFSYGICKHSSWYFICGYLQNNTTRK